MDKFSDGFSHKSYDDLLNEYAGESLKSKVGNRSEPPHRDIRPQKREEKDIFSKSQDFSRQEKPINQTPKRAEAPKRTEEYRSTKVPRHTETPKRTPTSSPAPHIEKLSSSRTERRVNTDISSNSKQGLDLRKIKSFDEKMNAQKTPVNKSRAHSENNDTMEFKKGKVPSSSQKKPVIEKLLSNEASSNIKKKIGNMGGKGALSDPKSAKEAMIKAFKVNKKVFITLAVCFAVSIVISVMLLSCVNDVLAIGRDSEESIEVVLPNGADTETAISVLDDAGLIKNKLFCTIFIKAMSFSDKNYLSGNFLPGVYYFTEDMGLEKMIKRFKTSSSRGAMISITIPEGYTIDKIFERLEKNEICTASSLYKTLDTVDFSSEYKFIPSKASKPGCYHILEGYFFPATYEFEQGADPATVVRTFLNAFQKHWTEEYAKKAEELGMSVDDIITLASIIEKEGANAKQFTQISSVLHNRLNKSGLYPLLECNSTKDYVTNTITARVTSKSELNDYILNYNTYEHEGLPAGAICNPGEAAIEAALYPEITQYYFFRHDKNKKIYMAETYEQHKANERTVAKVNASK